MPKSMENKVCAGFFVRLVAFAIDSILAAMAVSIVKMPLGIASGSLKFLDANFLFQFSIIDVISYLGVAAYFVLLTYFAHATVGKMLLQIEVVAENENWSFLNILYRETIGRFLSSIMNIGYLAVLVTKHKQGFHDMLCDTYVVYKKMQKEKAPKLSSQTRPDDAITVQPTVTEEPVLTMTDDAAENHPDTSEMLKAPTYHQ